MNSNATRMPPLLQPTTSSHRGRLALVILALLGATLVLFLFDPSQSGFYPRCWFHEATGLWCPGCGTLRALHQVLHGEFLAALHYNALLVLGLAWLGGHLGRAALTGRPLRWAFRPRWLWAGCFLLLVFGVARNLPFGPLVWLAP